MNAPMLAFLKYILQLLLSPASGWDDIASGRPAPEELLHRGLYPLLAVAALTEFLALTWNHDAGFVSVLIRSIVDFGAYFISIFVARLLFEMYFPAMCKKEPDRRRVSLFIIFALGIMVIFQILDNVVPWDTVYLSLLPLYAVLVIYKSEAFLGVAIDSQMRFLLLGAGATVAVPLAIYYFLLLILP